MSSKYIKCLGIGIVINTQTQVHSNCKFIVGYELSHTQLCNQILNISSYRPCYDIVTNVENVTFEKTAIKVLRFFDLRFRMQNLHGIERNSEDR